MLFFSERGMSARISHVEEEILRWATPYQAQKLRMINTTGSISAAARELGINQSALSRTLDSVKKRASMQGYSPEFNMNNPVPEGYRVSGVSSYYSPDGKLQGQWVKSTADQEQRDRVIRETYETLAKDLPRIKPSVAPKVSVKELCNLYVMTDCHVGMLAWHKDRMF
jgi:transposase-like protein